MRGFRASRAVQNLKSSRFGSGTGSQPSNKQDRFETINQQQNQNPHAVTKLPEWLRMPAEAKVVKLSVAREARAAKSAKPSKAVKTAKKAVSPVRRVRKAA